ncbi:MAG TPA: bifunctional oligoribonuclease/PAP phosphatase NrnA [bacterium]|nr:bifunctional oligoribonuclease/PAP phosphatase NrnA [bacterium]
MSPAAKIAETLKSRQHVLLLNHVSPDGDCLGSTLALARALRGAGRRATVGSSDGVPEMYRFLPGSSTVLAEIPEGERFDAVVFMECSSPERAGALAARAAGVPLWVNVDHHVSNTGYGDLVLWDPGAAAVAEVVFPIVTAFQPRLDPETAVCLMTALLTDTGSFHYASVTPKSFELAAELVRAGASPMAVFEQVYENRSTSSLRLLGMALVRMTICEDGRVAWTTITQAMLKEAGATMEESEGVVGALRTVRGIQVAILFKEESDEISVSLRGVGSVRANVIAEAFGGGGHAAAAGFTVKGPVDDVVRQTLAAVRRELSAATL